MQQASEFAIHLAFVWLNLRKKLLIKVAVFSLLLVKCLLALFIQLWSNVVILLVNANVEARLVVQAVRVNTLSKLTFADSKRFDALVRDIFPGVDFKGVEYAKLADALRAAAQESNLMVMETQVRGRWEW